MTNRASFGAAIALLFVGLLMGTGCGRSSLDENLSADDGGVVGVPDANADAATSSRCDARTCPNGCCDASGTCHPGRTTAACGTMGQACRDCPAAGFAACDPVAQACNTAVQQCDGFTCSGCCAGNACFMGADPNHCGVVGRVCQNCAASGTACIGGQCVAPACGPSNCTGCCMDGRCLSGVSALACGHSGQQCAACRPGDSCSTTGGPSRSGTCVPQPCSPATCRSGCCDALGVCQPGSSSAACGAGGNACVSCVSSSELCLGQRCTTVPKPCNPQTCPFGCCDAAGVCQSGIANALCGLAGGSCFDCGAFGTCVGGKCAIVCDARTCPSGCCTASGFCLTGNSDSECGTGGRLCADCTTVGDQCTNKRCLFVPRACNPQTCPLGCCDALDHCQPGASSAQCGTSGNSCQRCVDFGAVCSGQQCGGPDAGTCNAESCPTGCCDAAGQCQQGLTALECGTFGTNCQSCIQNGEQCSVSQQCVLPADGGRACNAQTCPNGCCDAAGNCQAGSNLTECGSFGGRCVDCSLLGAQCSGNACVGSDAGTPCPQSCTGCCDRSGQCQPGFVDSLCGELGNTCQDCTGLRPASTCDASVSPRTCSSQQTQCPAPYPGCPAALQQRAPNRQRVCSMTDLQNAAAACSSGPTTAACSAFFMFESSANPACAGCLQPFDVDFAAQSGVRACAAAFVDATCNHNSACIVDCTTQACFGCVDAASALQCETQAQSATCASFTMGDQCMTQALGGAAAVCNPATYQGSFGRWLQGVGATYCGP
ncbi:MAG: hypothetical protein M3O50_08980 [Myxococcota bacterium]|nr:hypothetical protein [Myxococcota bacterium]